MNKEKSFLNECYSKDDWLCGSSVLEKLFCWPCLLFCSGTSPNWTKTGYTDMRSFMSDGEKYEKSKSHLTAYKMWKTYGVNVGLNSLLSQARRDEIKWHNKK